MSSDAVERLLAAAGPARRPGTAATTLPPALFNDADWFAAECERVFHAGWVAVARSSELPEGNDFITTSIGGEPCIVVRNRDGGLDALSNLCRHRFTTLISDARGSAPSLQCPYHLWTYRHDGQLLAAPEMEQTEGFSIEDTCLPRFAVLEWHGWVFVNIDADATPIDEQAPGLGELFEAHRVAEMVSVGRAAFPTPWNWKIILENFAESYHHRGVHPETLDAKFPGFQSFTGSVGDEPWSSLDHVCVVDDSEPFLVLTVYPSLLLAVSRSFGVAWFRLQPLSAQESMLEIEAFVLPEFADIDGIGTEYMDALTSVNDEDTDINRRTAEGLRSKFADLGPLSHLEGSVAHFHRWLLDMMDRGGRRTG